MLSINERIKLILDRKGINDKDLAAAMGVSRSRLSQIFKSGVWDDLKHLRKVAEFTGFPLEYIVDGKLSDQEVDSPDASKGQSYSSVAEPDLSGKTIRPLTITLSPSGVELVTYVPVKAQAGYMRGYADPQFIEKLPAFSLPGVIKDQATYRMFEVNGDSMLQLGSKGLHSGDIVIARYLEDIFTLKDNRVYVIVTPDGVAIKRVLNRLKDKDSPCLVLMSDNKNGEYPNYLAKPKQILEVWEAKKVISSDFSFDTDLYVILGDLQTEQAKLRERVDELTRKP